VRPRSCCADEVNRTEGVVSAVAEVYTRHAYLDDMRDAIAKWETQLASFIKLQSR
jgi:hypothetical protein